MGLLPGEANNGRPAGGGSDSISRPNDRSTEPSNGVASLERSRARTAAQPSPYLARLEPVSVGHRTALGSRRQFLPGKGLARPETAPAFLATTAYFARQRLAVLGSPAPKPREVKDNSTGARKPDLHGTAWWRTHFTATGLQPQFPDNREINRVFLDFGPLLGDSRS